MEPAEDPFSGPAPAPVFVDDTGRRRLLTRRVGRILVVGFAGYLGLLVIGFGRDPRIGPIRLPTFGLPSLELAAPPAPSVVVETGPADADIEVATDAPPARPAGQPSRPGPSPGGPATGAGAGTGGPAPATSAGEPGDRLAPGGSPAGPPTTPTSSATTSTSSTTTTTTIANTTTATTPAPPATTTPTTDPGPTPTTAPGRGPTPNGGDGKGPVSAKGPDGSGAPGQQRKPTTTTAG